MLNERTKAKLPVDVAEAIEDWSRHLAAVLGEDLISLVLYGGAARGEYLPHRSDVNLMVVVKNVSLEVLDRLAPLVDRGGQEWRLAPWVLSLDDLRRSTDVFPIKFLDIQRCHHVLAGQPVLAGLAISRNHLRLRCEQEIKNLLLRLRQFYLRRAHRPELIEATLVRGLSGFLVSLSVLVELRTGQVPATRLAVIEAVGPLGLDTKVLRDVLALKRGESKAESAALKLLYSSFMMTVQRAAELADELEPN